MGTVWQIKLALLVLGHTIIWFYLLTYCTRSDPVNVIIRL